MKKLVPDTLLTDREQVRLATLSLWDLNHGATEIVMTERQFWKFATLQPDQSNFVPSIRQCSGAPDFPPQRRVPS